MRSDEMRSPLTNLMLNVSADCQICCDNYYIPLYCLEAAYLLTYSYLVLHDAYLVCLVLFGHCHVRYIRCWLTFSPSVAVLTVHTLRSLCVCLLFDSANLKVFHRLWPINLVILLNCFKMLPQFF